MNTNLEEIKNRLAEINRKYDVELEKLNENKNNNEAKENIENLKSEMRSGLLEYKRKFHESDKYVQMMKNLKTERSKLAQITNGRNTEEVKNELTAEHEKLHEELKNIRKDNSLDENSKYQKIATINSKINEIENDLNQIKKVYQLQAEKDKYFFGEKDNVFEKYRTHFGLTGISFEKIYNNRNNKNKENEVVNEEKVLKNEVVNQENLEKNKHSETNKDAMHTPIFNNSTNLEQTQDKNEEMYEQSNVNQNEEHTKHYEEAMNTPKYNDSPNFEQIQVENEEMYEQANFNQNDEYQKGYEAGYNEGVASAKNAAYDDPYLRKNEETYTFKEFMKLPMNKRIDYYVYLTGEQAEALVKEISEGLDNGTISPEEVINFRRIGNRVKLNELAMSKVAEEKILTKSYNAIYKEHGLKSEKIESEKYGLKTGIFERKLKFEGYTQNGEPIMDARKVNLNLDNPADIEALEAEIKDKYEETYNILYNKMLEDNIDYYNDKEFGNSVHGKFMYGYNLYLDRIMYLKKFEAFEKRMEDFQIDERICEEYRKKNIIKGNYYTNDELLTKNKLLKTKPNFKAKIMKKLRGKKYFDKTQDRRFQKAIDKCMEEKKSKTEIKSMEEINSQSKMMETLNQKVNSQETIIKNNVKREQMNKELQNDLEKNKDDLER